MFICETCLRANYANHPGIFRSRGPCEICTYTKECYEIKSSLLIPLHSKPGKKKILIIGQAPPAVEQKVPYDTTMLYVMLSWAGVSMHQAQDMFEFDACSDKFPGFGENSHKVPTVEEFNAYMDKSLFKKISDADKIIVLGNVARDYLYEHHKAKVELNFKKVVQLIHPSKRNYHRIMQDRTRITEKLKTILQ